MSPVQIAIVSAIGAALVAAVWSGMRNLRARWNAEAELANLAGRLFDVQEEERARIARELHDGISQQLAVVALKLDGLEYRLPGSSGPRAEIALLAQRVRVITEDLQHVARGLHPARLQHLGLVRSVRALAREMEHDQIHIDVVEAEWPADLPSDVVLSLYRVAQEALHNATKHSGSDLIAVSFRRDDDDGLNLIISDRGIGFRPQPVGSLGGLGIVSMRQRLRTLGGSLSITAAPGEGTTVHARLPRQMSRSEMQVSPSA